MVKHLNIVTLIISIFICWSYARVYNDKREYASLLKNVMNRLERFENDEVLHRRHSQRNAEEDVFQQRKNINRDQYYDYHRNSAENEQLLQMLQNKELVNKRNRIYHKHNDMNEFVDRNHEDSLINEDDDFDQNLIDEEGDEGNDGNNNVEEIVQQSIKMPNVSPQEKDTYLCFAHKLPSKDSYIVEFNPLAKQQIAHHMLLFGCNEPFKENVHWECREMSPICMGQQQIMYAWAKNAPSLTLPEDVAFHVGGDSGVNYLVLQVHYLDVSSFKKGHTDTSGLTFKMSQKMPHYFAGIYLLADGFTPIPPHKKAAHIDMGCNFTSKNDLTPKIFPFRFRVHAHKLGVVITGYRVRDGKWTLIGRGDPQKPQAFNPVFNDLDIQNGDLVYGRCTYNSMKKTTVTNIGATHNDEMCNFYIMYFYKRPTNKAEAVAATSLPCGYPASFHNMEWPKDSDTPLAEMEQRNREIVDEDADNVPLYHVINGWPKYGNETGNLPLTTGQIAGVACNEKRKEVFVFERADRAWGFNTFIRDTIKNKTPIEKPTIIVLDSSDGDIINFGATNIFSMPHGITVDDQNNIWVTDVGRHQVFKLSPSLEVLLTVGHAFNHSSEPGYFCKPTDVAVMRDGSFFVADGYCNGRVVKYDKEGNIVFIIDQESFGAVELFPKPRSMLVVHSLALDENSDRLFVADRENQRILIFKASTGEFIDYVKKGTFEGAVYAIAFASIEGFGDVLHVVNGPVGMKAVKVSGFTYSLQERKVVSKWGPPDGGFNRPHDISSTADSRNIYVAEIGPNKIWKFERQIIPNEFKRSRP